VRLTNNQREWLALQQQLLVEAGSKADDAARRWRKAKDDLLGRAEDNGWPRVTLDEAARNDTALQDAADDERYFGQTVVRKSAAIVGFVTATRALVESDDEIRAARAAREARRKTQNTSEG
jgi:hypothetical protein